MMTRLSHLTANERGAAVIELALVAPMLALMVIGVVDMSNAMSRKLQAEQAAHRALEKVMNTTASGTVEDTIKAEAVCQVNGANADGTCKTSPLTPADVKVTYRLECDGTVTAAIECAEGQTASKWITVEVNDKYTPLFPVRFAGINGDGTYHLRSTAGMRVQ